MEKRYAHNLRRFVESIIAKCKIGEMNTQEAADQLRINSVPMNVAVRVLAKEPKNVIIINGIEVPAPANKPLKNGQLYWTPCVHSINKVVTEEWASDIRDIRMMALGLVHLNRDAAVKHTEALLSFTRIEPK